MRHYCLATFSFFVVLLFFVGCGTPKKVQKPKPPIVSVKDTADKVYSLPKPWVRPLNPDVAQEFRAVWLTTIYGLDWPRAKADTKTGEDNQKQELLNILDRLKSDGYNTVFLQVRLRGSVIYPSAYEPWDRVFTNSGNRPNYDPLDFAVKACHERGLKCHAWLVTFPLGGDKASYHTPRSNHPQWCVRHMGEWYLNPGIPEVRSYIAKLCEEIVRKYPVDGIHLDYVRYPENASTFNDRQTYERYGQGVGLSQWRRDNITALLKEIKDTITAISPSVVLSAATLGKLRNLGSNIKPHGWTAYESVYQDVIAWDKERVLDMVLPMMYYKDDLFEPFLLDWQRSLKSTSVVAGLGPYRIDEVLAKNRWTVDDIICQLDYLRGVGIDGVCFFREMHVGNRFPKMRDAIKKKFEKEALLPPIQRGKEMLVSEPKDLKLIPVDTIKNKYRLSWKIDLTAKQKGQECTFNVWAKIDKTDGTKEGCLIAKNVKTTSIDIPVDILLKAKEIEFGVEAVNSLGVATPCRYGVMYRKL